MCIRDRLGHATLDDLVRRDFMVSNAVSRNTVSSNRSLCARRTSHVRTRRVLAVAQQWVGARWAKSEGPPSAGAPEFQANLKNNFPVTVKIRTPGHQRLYNVLLQHSQLRECMRVLCTWMKLLTDLQILGCELHKKCVWRPGSA